MNWNIERLEERIRERAQGSSGKSYTKQLLDEGTRKCAKKLGEEAVETAMAAVSEDDERLVSESADLVFHLLVLLRSRNIPFSLVGEELQRREEKSGIEEKASRQS